MGRARALKFVLLIVTILCLWHVQVRGAGRAHADSPPKAPVWPSSFKVKFKFIVPYVTEYQQGGPLIYDMRFWRDSVRGLQRIERSEEELWIESVDKNLRWYVSPGNRSEAGCLCENLDDGGGPSRRLQADVYELLSPALPKVEEPRWSFEKSARVNTSDGAAIDVDVWHYHVSHDEGYGTIDVDWRLSVTPQCVPVTLDMWGVNWFTGGHWDHYTAEFYEFEADPAFAADEFDMPAVCKGVKPRPPDIPPLMGGHHLTSRLHAAASGVLPPAFYGDAEYDGHVAKYGRRHSHRREYEARRAEFHRNKAFIAAHNNNTRRSYSVALNHLADWTRDEYRALLKASAATRIAPPANLGFKPLTHKPTIPLHMLPATVDWRGTQADSPIKDQAMCGSCWAFAAVAPMETAYYRTYAQQKLLSEQYLMDCSWEFGNNGCNGGFQDKAFSFVLANKGIASNADYPYVGVNMPCRKNVTKKSAAFKSFVNVAAYEPDQLKEALLTKGPMTVSLDADDPGFAFYKEGVFFNPTCKTRPPEQLDHAVMISGYGRDPATGQRFWILKNIWTTYWGELGYMRMSMDVNDCGITALPQYVELDKHETDRLRAENA